MILEGPTELVSPHAEVGLDARYFGTRIATHVGTGAARGRDSAFRRYEEVIQR